MNQVKLYFVLLCFLNCMLALNCVDVIRFKTSIGSAPLYQLHPYGSMTQCCIDKQALMFDVLQCCDKD